MKNIVTRLCAVFHNDRSVELMNREAADEIDRLRAERDEARREICQRISGPRWHPQFPLMSEIKYAEARGWDCFKEDAP